MLLYIKSFYIKNFNSDNVPSIQSRLQALLSRVIAEGNTVYSFTIETSIGHTEILLLL